MKKKLILSVLSLMALVACDGVVNSGTSSSVGDTSSSESSSSVAAPTIIVSTNSVSLNLHEETGKTTEVSASLTGDASGEFEWKSNDTQVVTLTPNGNKATLTALAKGKTTVTVSVKNNTTIAPVTINVSVLNYRPWTTEEENAMKEHLYGIVLEPTEKDKMKTTWDEKGNQITIEGDTINAEELEEYASSYTEEKGWYSVSDRYSVEEGTAYMFEKKATTENGDRYVRAFMYITSGEHDDLSTEGKFWITAFDPYVYEWPTEKLKAMSATFFSIVEIPKVESQHYYLTADSITAYLESTEKDGGYSSLLTTAGFKEVTEIENGDYDYYRALSSDELYDLNYIYVDGALEISFGYPLTSYWPSKAITAAFTAYNKQGATAFEVPAFEGQNLTFMFNDGLYNASPLHGPLDLYGTVTVMSSSLDLTNAYKEKLKSSESGWTEIGEGSGKYQKKVVDSGEESFANIDVAYDDNKKQTTINIYYVPRADATKGWNADAVATALGKYVTDTIPAYEGEIDGFTIEGDTIYVKPKDASNLDAVKEAYIQTLTNNHYVAKGSNWLLRYYSPNNQIKLTVSTTSEYSSSHPNCLYIIFEEMPSEWNDARVKELLQEIGSSVETILKPTSQQAYLCSYKKNSDSMLTLSLTCADETQKFTEEEYTNYIKQFDDSSDWTLTTENTYQAKDTTTVKLAKNYDLSKITITITAPTHTV